MTVELPFGKMVSAYRVKDNVTLLWVNGCPYEGSKARRLSIP